MNIIWYDTLYHIGIYIVDMKKRNKMKGVGYLALGGRLKGAPCFGTCMFKQMDAN